MLRFILGRAGSGKTHAAREELKALAQGAGNRLMLIVPEQFSFETERAMLHLLGAKDVQRVSVTSFSRLADAVFRRYGGAAGRKLDDGGRNVLMSLALEQVQGRLTFYRKNAENTELIGPMLSVSAELKQCDVGPQDLSRAAEKMAAGTLKRKTEELSLILSAYDALVARSYVDPLDDLTRVRNLVREHRFFEGYTVFMDSFQSFTVQEYNLIDLILAQSGELTVTLCTDRLDDPERGVGLFSPVRRTARILMRLAQQNGVRVAAPVMLGSGKRFRSPDLAALEAGVYRFAREKAEAGGKDTVVYEAENVYDESDFVAAKIRELVMREGCRYRDFAVIARLPERYRGILSLALERRGIPYFMDEPGRIDTEPLMRMVLSAFEVVTSGFSTESVLSYLKTGLAGFSAERISQLENYVFVWSISGKRWHEEWTQHPQGFAETMTEQDRCALEEINESRAAAVSPLEHFSARVRETDGEGMARAVFRLLEETGAAEHLRELAGRLSACGEPALAERQLRLWDLLMNLLDQTALVLRERPVAPARYRELLRLVILANDMASIPQGLDEVTVGTADRIRMTEPKVVFLIGTVQGEFPLVPGGNGMFSDTERRELIQIGLPLNDTMEGAAVQERFLAYSAMSAASHKLFLSYPLSGEKGEANAPSSIPEEARSVLRGIPVLNRLLLPQTFFANAKEPAFELMAQQWGRNTVLSATLKRLFAGRGESRRLEAIDRAARRRPAAFADREKARALFGASMHVSATQIESFYLCRFQYFCRYGLRAKERRTAELDALEYGSLMHFLLERLFRDTGSERILAMEPEELKREIRRLLEEYAALKLGGAQERSPRFRYLLSRLADSAQVISVHIARELMQSGFAPADFELPIGEGGIDPLKIPLPGGGIVEIDGKVDRVDLMTRDGVSYVRIIDYKTGKKEFRLSDLIYGINMQMLIYLAALCENGASRYGTLRPAGVLYMPANRPVVSAARGTAPEKLREEAEKKLRMDGLVLDDAAVISAMEQGGKGKYLPVALKNGVPGKRDHVASAEELSAILRHIKGLVGAMARELHGGDVAAVPLSGDIDACAWCPYAAVCGHEKDSPVREMEKWDRDRAVAELTGEGKGESS